MRGRLAAAALAFACGAGLQPGITMSTLAGSGVGRAEALPHAEVSRAEALPHAEADAQASGWSTIVLPMERTAFAELVGLDPALPRVLLLPQAIRRLHDADVRASDLRARVAAALHGPASGATEVPLPLDIPTWCREILAGCTPQSVAAALLADPRAGFAYLGLANLDAPTRAFVSASPRLLRWIARERAGALAAFGDAIRVSDGRVVVPGGPGAERAWSAMAGVSPDQPEAFVRSVLATGDGRLAYFFDTVSHLDTARQRLALGPTPGSARAMADRFAAIPATWQVEVRPFLRPPTDPASVLLRLAVDADGRLAGPRAKAFWRLAFEPDGPPPPLDRAAVLGGEEADAAWIALQVAGEESGRRLARLQAFLFAQRRMRSLDAIPAADAVEVARASMRMPALVFSLERAGVADVPLVAALARRARALTGIVSASDRAVVLAEWQSALALVARLSSNGTLDAASARARLASLAALETTDDRFGTGLERWLRDDLLRALTPGATGDGELEPALLDALAGVGVPRARTASIDWEGARYVLDPAASERARLGEVRTRQDAPALDDALEAFAIAETIRSGAPDAALGPRIASLASRLPARGAPDRGAAETSRVLARLVAQKPGARRTREHEALVRAAEHLLADTLTGIVYACAVGSPDDRVFLAGDISARHDFGAERPGMPPGPSPPWALAAEQAAAGRPWHMQGSLVGLDVPLGRLRLRRLLGSMPAHQSLVNAAERSALVLSVVLTPGTIDEQDATAVVGAMERGRARVRGASDDERGALCADAGLCGWRSEIVAWARRREPDAALATVTRAELAWAGRDPSRPFADAWGTASAVDGELAVRFPAPLPIETIAGRPTLAHGLTAFADLKLRLAELLVARRLPASLARELGAAALQDFLDEVQPAYPDDWLAFSFQADRMDPSRADDYLSALTIPGGPLVPFGAAR